MRPLPLIVLAVCVSAVAGGLAALAVAPESSAQAQGAPTGASSEIAASLARLETRQGEFEKSIADLRDSLASNAHARSEVVDVDAAIERWMKANAASLASATPAPVAAPSTKSRQQRVTEALAQLSDEALDDVERQRLWREFAKEGLTDELLAEYERRVELDPNNPDLKVDLAGAYFMKLGELPPGPESGVWATKADKLLDDALALDEGHWEARFTKAVALSFWPPFLGKQKEAVSHLEILVAQQAGQPKQEQFAQTHLILGNMYQQLGQADKAVAAWQVGYAQFPNDADLKKQLDLYGAH